MNYKVTYIIALLLFAIFASGEIARNIRLWDKDNITANITGSDSNKENLQPGNFEEDSKLIELEIYMPAPLASLIVREYFSKTPIIHFANLTVVTPPPEIV